MEMLKGCRKVLLAFIFCGNIVGCAQNPPIDKVEFIGAKDEVLFVSKKEEICNVRSEEAYFLETTFCANSPTIQWLAKKPKVSSIRIRSTGNKIIIAKPMTMIQSNLPVADLYFIVDPNGIIELENGTIVLQRFKFASKEHLDSLFRK
jgi:hypothetical protein